jgi:ubiquinone/menaquinone biosynthesis C-methylase UbiE
MNPSKQRVNYDQISSQYNQRYQENPLVRIERALIQLARRSKARTILEVGCGTGRWLGGLARHLPDVQLFGLDYSHSMLTQAQDHPAALGLVRAKGGLLPLKAGSFDLVFCVNALHHFDDPQAFAAQARQLLQPGGILAIIGQVPQDRRNRWFVYDYFEGTYAQDLERFPAWGSVVEWMIGAGFQEIHWQPVEWVLDDKVGRAVLDDPFLQKHAVSQLALLSDEAYQAGIEKIKAALNLAESRGETLVFKVALRLDLLTGKIPEEDKNEE